MSGSDEDRRWRLLLQEMEDRAAMFKVKPDNEKETFFAITSKEIMELGRALEALTLSNVKKSWNRSSIGAVKLTSSARVGLCLLAQDQPLRPWNGVLRCQLSDTDPRFPKYPRQPVETCAGDQSDEGDDSEGDRQ